MLVSFGQLLTGLFGCAVDFGNMTPAGALRRGRISFSNNWVSNCLGVRVIGAGVNSELALAPFSEDILLIGNTFVGCKNFVFSPVNGLVISNNSFLSCGTMIIGDHEAMPIPSKLAKSVHITQNSFDSSGEGSSGVYGSCAAIQIEYANGVEIAGNDFKDCGLKGTAASGAGVVIQLAGGPVSAICIHDNSFSSPKSVSLVSVSVGGGTTLDTGSRIHDNILTDGISAAVGWTPAYMVYSSPKTGVKLSANATSWSTVSDARSMHTDAEPIENALAKLSALRAVIGRTTDEPSHVRRPCLLAQEVQLVFPEAVDRGDPSELSLRYAELVPLLVAAINELATQ
jgi:hypothetical protein